MEYLQNRGIHAKGETRPEISILLPTCNRTALLEDCLDALLRQRTTRTFEVIVIDNAPHAGYTNETVTRFPDVRLIAEPRRGLSYARNAGIRSARGEIVVFTDDDTQAAPDWLENLVAPFFARAEIAAVTGQTLPLKVENEAERLFEAYGGLGCGKAPAEFDLGWLSSQWHLPLWQIGTTANAAFRTRVFRHPAVGLLDERLGAGSPAGAWEDLYLFYRILRAGYVIAYRPGAKMRHAHRQTLPELSKQLQAYRRGEVAFCLLSLNCEREWRALLHLALWIPYWRGTQLLGELLRRTRGQKLFRLPMLWREWCSYLYATAALFLSHRRVQKWATAPGEAESVGRVSIRRKDAGCF
jgi:GT2 family glycosyltransferase